MVSLRNDIAEWTRQAIIPLSLTADSNDLLAKGFIEDILTFIILYNNLIPISLIVTMEVVKFQQAQFINWDLDMYYAKTDTPALCRTSSLVEELGQIEYVFSDKTGTLTCNEMEFKMCSIGGTAYADVVDESKKDGVDGADGWKSFAEMRSILDGADPFRDVPSTSSALASEQQAAIVREFLTLLAVCHTVIPEVKNGKMVYQASSPDEAALVAGAELLGFKFTVSLFPHGTRTNKLTFIEFRRVNRSRSLSMSWVSNRSSKS